MEDEIIKRLERIERNMRPLADDKAWTVADVAAYIQCSEQTVRRMSKQAGFPKPSRAPTDTDGTRAAPRYEPDEIRAWLFRSANRAS